MSLRSQVVQVSQELLDTTGELTFEKVRMRLESQGITIPQKSSIIRSTVYQMRKKNPDILLVQKGVYRLAQKQEKKPAPLPEPPAREQASWKAPVQPDSASKSITQIDQQLMELFSQLENFKWLEHTDEEILEMKHTWRLLKALYAAMGKRIRRLE